MEIKNLKINDEVSVMVSSQRLRDTDDEKWVYEPIFETAKVVEVDKNFQFALIIFADGKWGELDKDSEWYKVPSNTKIATHSEVKRPHHYMFENGTEAIKIINMIVKRYKQSIVAAQIYNAIKYIVRAPFKKWN
ncbi:DUF3310 domain-containing protein [Staphylococcus delphini]|uniref:DUF3310 domain-containing protein n=1 Tax=Staphylococcus delphini TaxID=53344 RepID=UPI001F4E768F|nr:DUF3310 domain-containing protein [Staphylococcus delphini]